MLEDALESLRRGRFVLLHDSAGREDEVDMVVSAASVTPGHVSQMRARAGGLLCAAIDGGLASRLGLRYMHEMLAESPHRDMVEREAPYGDRPSFSISVNHAGTYTGITDRDRALTIRSLAGLHGAADARAEFASSFRAPGHVPLLAAAPRLLEERRGHTEMSVYMARLAGLPPVTAVCEMLDSGTHGALSVGGARRAAAELGVPLVDGSELLEYARVRSA